MKISGIRSLERNLSGERGGSRLNFLIVLLVIAVSGYCVSQYAPVAYKALAFREFMQETVTKAAYPPGQSNDWVESQLRAKARENDLPPNIYINVRKQDGQLVVEARWTKPIPLLGFVYEYTFDHTVKSSSFIGQ